MGEGGENNVDWLMTAFQLYEDSGIWWNFWPWKKIDTITSPRSIRPPAGWDAIRAYAEGRGPRPAEAAVRRSLGDLLEAMQFEHTDDRAAVTNAVLRRVPLRLPASGFGFLGQGVSYATRDAKPMRSFRSDDQVTIRPSSQRAGNEAAFDHNDGRPRATEEMLEVVLDAGEWVSYAIEVPTASRLTARLALDMRGRAPGDAPSVRIGADDMPTAIVRGSVEAASTATIQPGIHTITITAQTAGTVLRSIEVRPAQARSRRTGGAG